VPHRVCAMSMTQNTPDFGAVTSFEDGEVTIALRGTAEHGSAFALGAILDAAIDRHPASMVLDVAELESLGATGLLAVFDAEKRLAASGVTLTIRSPSVLVNRLLGIMESAETSRRERSLPKRGHLGPEQMGETSAVSSRFASSLSAKDLRRVTAMPAIPT
jgi:anti-sigma B factor antagonist